MSLGGWITFSQIGGLLFLADGSNNSNRILRSHYNSVNWQAYIGYSSSVRVFSGLVSSLFGPTQARHCLRAKDWTAFSNYLLRSLRLTTLFFALCCWSLLWIRT